MFPRRLQHWARGVAEAIVSPLAQRGVNPNAVTVAGFVFNVGTAAVLAMGHLTIGGVLLLLAGTFDMLDGALARVTSTQSDFGAFLDSLLDRYSEAAILLALVYVFSVQQKTAAVLLVFAVAVGSILSSYARARAEGLGIECRVGIAPRPERVIILGLGLLVNDNTTIAALAILAVLTHFTAVQRLYHVWSQTRSKSVRQRSKKASRVAPRGESPAP
jgi:CDP-diacylglycerol--glycerol-3-phosphate 3-phosphatidyltransferase